MSVTDSHHVAMANHMRPQNDALPGDVSPQNVESLVPVVELLIISRLEARAPESEGLNVVTLAGFDDALRDMRGIGNILIRRWLSA
jgi:hypothetical protein